MDIEKIVKQVGLRTSHPLHEIEFLPFIEELEIKARDVAKDINEDEDWVTDVQTGTMLYRLAAGRRCLDMGSFTGFTSHCMALAEGSVVDAFDGHSYPEHCWEGTPEEQKITNLQGSCGVVVPPKTRHWSACPKRELVTYLKPRLRHSYGLIFLDASHHPPGVKGDTEFCLRALEEGGVLICHDFHFLREDQQIGAKGYGVPPEWFRDKITPLTFYATKSRPDRRFIQTVGIAVK